ncbi:MAG: hypothetical protein M4579_003561 [Chaenotheca gracillima]|nr:MAG: hypothetical protein M4579_003561 [Chaenotheca gracillima]
MQPLIAVPVTLLLVYRAWSRRSLSPLGIVAAVVTATAHALHPWSIFFALLIVFFVGGTTVTKIKHEVKQHLTLSSDGAQGGEGARTHVQVLANSLTASVLILLHAAQLRQQSKSGANEHASCWPYGGDLLVVGIVANYAAVAADTFSSELGILSKSPPRLITSPTLRRVPPGTNGGVTSVGVLAGLLGAFTIGVTSAVLLPFCSEDSSASSWFGKGASRSSAWSLKEQLLWVVVVTVWGGLGSLLDSFLGGWLQASVVDTRSGKVVEGHGGKRVLVSMNTSPSTMHSDKMAELKGTAGRGDGSTSSLEKNTATAPEAMDPVQARQRHLTGNTTEKPSSDEPHQPSRVVESGISLLDNNGVNFLMALIMSLSGMGAASWYWNVPLRTIIS